MSSQTKSSGKTYYDTIKNESTLDRESQGKPTLRMLLQSGWKGGASQWGREQLLAHRVVCSGPAANLSFLKPFFIQEPNSAGPCITTLIQGPGSISALLNSSETQIMHRHKPDSLGYVWAAFLPFLRAPGGSVATAASVPSTPEPKRQRKAPERYGGGVPSDQVDLGSSPDFHGTKQRPPSSDSDSSFSSVGFTDTLKGAIFEDAGIRLASCFIRCVLNYAQPVNKREPFVQFRDERLTYSYRLGGSERLYAADDGGMQIFDDRGNPHQVALLEGKRNVQKITDGVAEIPDELLGQMVGQALALILQ